MPTVRNKSSDISSHRKQHAGGDFSQFGGKMWNDENIYTTKAKLWVIAKDIDIS